jgi:hypothetical protein
MVHVSFFGGGDVGMNKSLQDPMVQITSPCATLRPWWAVALVPVAATSNATQASNRKGVTLW